MGRYLGVTVSLESRGRVSSHGLRRSRFPPFLLLALPLLNACAPDRDAGEEGLEELRAVPGSVRRAVSLVPSLSELAIALGAGENLAARTDFDTHPELMELPSVGGGLDPNIEGMVGLGIDMVLLPGGRATGTVGRRLRELGMEVHVLPTNTVPDLYAAMVRLGELFDVSPAADSLSRQMKEEISEIVELVVGRDPVPVMYVVAPEPPTTTGGGTFIDELIRVAGGRNVFSDAGLQWPSVSFESILNRDPELLVWPRGDYGTVSLESLKAAPGWKELPAVRDGRVLFVDGNLFSRPGPGFPEAARSLAMALHPDAFAPARMPTP
jgi:iron complex transport system substrate-binding protein